MATFEMLPRFRDDYGRLTEEEKDAFWTALRDFVRDLNEGRRVRHSLRPKRIKGTDSIWEISWANDGRATFEYGAPVHEGQAHVIWRRVGTHNILREP
jgi:hypothetical protein